MWKVCSIILGEVPYGGWHGDRQGNWGMWQGWDGMGTNGKMGMGGSNPWNMMGIRLLLADTQGTIVVDSAALDTGKITSTDLAVGVPILVGNEQVGTLLPVSAGTNVSGAAGDFVSSVNQSTWLAGGIAALVALVLGSILFFQIVSPVQKLTSAAQKIAAGDLRQKEYQISHRTRSAHWQLRSTRWQTACKTRGAAPQHDRGCCP